MVAIADGVMTVMVWETVEVVVRFDGDRGRRRGKSGGGDVMEGNWAMWTRKGDCLCVV